MRINHVSYLTVMDAVVGVAFLDGSVVGVEDAVGAAGLVTVQRRRVGIWFVA